MRLVHYSYPSFRTVTPAFRSFQRAPWSGIENEIDRLFETALADVGWQDAFQFHRVSSPAP